MPPAIETQGLSKRYGRVRALDSLTLRIEPGEIFGFLGPNGAGKTTTIRLLLGLIRASSGSATMLGHDIGHGTAWRSEVGYLPGTLTLWKSLSGAQTLRMLADLTGRDPQWRDELLAKLDLNAADLGRAVGTYSDGMRQKLGIVQALQCAPKLVLLDEPSKGLDPLVQVAFYDILQDVARRGTTVFFSSHVLPEVERISHRVAMLRGGRLVSVGDVDNLRRALPRRVTISASAQGVGGTGRNDGLPDFSDFGQVVVQTPQRVELLVPVDRLQVLASRLASIPFVDFLVEPQTLEDAFMEQYR